MILANEAGWSMEDLERETERLRSESLSMGGTISLDDGITCHRVEVSQFNTMYARSRADLFIENTFCCRTIICVTVRPEVQRHG